MRSYTSSWIVAFAAMTAGACQEGEDPSISSSTAEVVGTNILMAGERLLPNESISSGSTVLIYQNDNNLVLYQNGLARWSSATDHGIPGRFEMQMDCNAVVYPVWGNMWSSKTAGRGSSCFAKVIEGDWFICSGTTRVFSARGGGSCGGQGSYVCHEPAFTVPLPGLEYYHVRIESSFLYVCDTYLGWEGHIPWPQPTQAEIDDQCIGACGAGCSSSTCSWQGFGSYVYMGGGLYCRDVQYDCYSADCCWYHDLCGRMYPTSLFTNPFCHALGIAYGCGACAGPGFVGCAVGPGYTRTFRHSYVYREDCFQTCVDPPGDCRDDCTGACWFGCDVNSDCLDDCYGDYICGSPCSLEEKTSGLRVRIGDYVVVWQPDELEDMSSQLQELVALKAEEEKILGLSRGVSLPAVVSEALSDGARVTAVIAEDDTRIEIAEDDWNSTDQTPVLVLEGDDRYRFQWLGAGSDPAGLEGVRTIEVAIDPDATLKPDAAERIMKCPCSNATACP